MCCSLPQALAPVLPRPVVVEAVSAVHPPVPPPVLASDADVAADKMSEFADPAWKIYLQ